MMDGQHSPSTRTPLPTLYSPQEAAKRLEISPSTLARLTKTGRIRPVRFNRTVRYTEDSLRSLIATSSEETTGGVS